MQEKIIAQRYRIIRALGGGGFGLTYLAEDIVLPGKPFCVVKQLNPQTNDPARLQVARRLFEQEAQVLYRLGSHDQIPNLLAHLEDEEEFYLVQEYINGESLDHEFLPGQQFSEPQVIGLLAEILEVLTFVHQQGVIHRDIKPANLMQRKNDGRIVLIDFGAVKQVSTTTMIAGPGSSLTIAVGSAGYLPGEQLAGRPQFSSDIYAVGMVCIQALTGVPPALLRQSARTGEILWQDKVQVSPPFASLLNKMVRYDFRQRFFSAAEALAALATLGPQMAANLAVAPAGMAAPLKNPPHPYPDRLNDSQARNFAPTEVGKQYKLSPNRSGPVAPTSAKPSSWRNGAAAVLGIIVVAVVVALAWMITLQPDTKKSANQNRGILNDVSREVKTSPPPNNPTPNNPTASAAFDTGLNTANEARAAANLARTKEDWEAVESKWIQAVGYMQAAREAHFREEEAKAKISEYERQATYAREKAALAPSIKQPSNAPPVIPIAVKPPERSERTYLTFNNYNIDSGNHIVTFTLDNGIFDVTSSSDNGTYNGEVRIFFRGPKDWYYLTFKAPGGMPLQRGTYENPISHPYAAKDKSGLDFGGNGSSCDTIDGRFTVHEIAYNSTYQVELLDITFERRCAASTTIAYGRVRYDRRDRRQ